MAPRDSRVNINLEATNRASGAINEVKQSLSGLEGAAGLATKGVAGLAGAFGAGMLLQFGQQVAGAIVDMGQLAAQSDLVRDSMAGLALAAGASGDEMLAGMKRASMGTIAEYDLMLAANKAMMLGVTANTGELEAMMKVALTRGAAMGLSTTQAFDNLVTGIGRGSALILDNLGISMGQLKSAEESYAATLGKTTAQLTDQEKKQAAVNAVLKEAASIDLRNIDDGALAFQQMGAAMADLKVAFGDAFGPLLTAAVQALTVAVNAIGDVLDRSGPTGFEERFNAMVLTAQAASTAFERLTFGMPEEEVGRIRDIYRELKAAGADIDQESMSHAYGAQLQALEEVNRALGEMVYLRETITALEQPASSSASPYMLDSSAMDWVQGVRSANAQAAQETEDAWAKALAGVERQVAGWQSSMYQAFGDMGFQLVDEATASLSARLQELRESGYSVEQALVVVGVEADALRAGLLGAATASTTTGDAIKGLGDRAAPAAVEIAKLGSAALGATPALAAMKAESDATAGALDRLAGAAARARQAQLLSSMGSVEGMAMNAAGALGAARAMQIYEDNTRTLQQAAALMAKTDMDATEVKFNLAEMTARMNNATMDEIRLAEEAARAVDEAAGGKGGGGLTGYASAMQGASSAGQQFAASLDSLKSKVAGVLSGALTLDVGVKPEDFLPREDAINENARRLADIMVNGFKGQDWLTEFANEVPDIYQALIGSGDPQTAAAQMLKNFEAGLVPGLIDREAVKEKVKIALLGEANMATLAAEITAELAAELGQSPLQIAGLVNSALGRSAGEDVSNDVITQLRSQNFLSAVDKVGSDAGTRWGSMFLETVGENVPPVLLDILAMLVTPLVLARMQNEGSRAGAQ